MSINFNILSVELCKNILCHDHECSKFKYSRWWTH